MPYATLQDLRDEGVTVEQLSDVRAAVMLARASAFIDRVTGQWFEPRTKTLTLDGNGLNTLWLDAVPITITSVTVDDLTVTAGERVAYGHPDDRDNPRMVMRNGCWPRGLKNVVVVGTFGYVDNDGVSPPPEIRDACMRLVMRFAALLSDASAQQGQAGDVRKETTDGHSYERFDRTAGTAGAWRFGGVTGDPAIDTTLRMFRRAPFVGRVG